MRVVVFGATGMVGQRIVQELERRGHEVVPATRGSGVDATDADAVARVVAGADAAVVAVSARTGDFTALELNRAVVDGLREAAVRRLVVVGGAGSLEVAPGQRLLDTPDFNPDWKDEALAHAELLDTLYRGIDDLDWTYVSPAAYIHPGERTGRYRLGGDQLLTDDAGNSEVSAEDYAIAIADLLESGEHARERVTAAW
jgi:putative NADH-flavin reductase